MPGPSRRRTLSADHRRRCLPYGAPGDPHGDGWVPRASRQSYADVGEFLPQFRQMATEAGRDPASPPIAVMFRVEENLDPLRQLPGRPGAASARWTSTPAAKADEVLLLLADLLGSPDHAAGRRTLPTRPRPRCAPRKA